jgi:Protein of unknown function (DUF3352)
MKCYNRGSAGLTWSGKYGEESFMSKSAGIAAAALLTATVAGAGGYYYLQNRDPGDKPEQLAQAVPEKAFAVGYVTTDSKVWSKLEKFGTAEAKQLVSRSLQQAQKEIISDVDYQKDIQPWLGNIMFAGINKKDDPSKGSLLVVSKVKDKISAYNFLTKFKDKGKTPAKETEYKSAKIWAVNTGKEEFYTAYLDDWLVGGSDLSAVQQSIDTIKGSPSFSKKNGNQFFASGKLNLTNPIASLYIDFPSLVAMAKTSSSKLTASQYTQLENIQSFTSGAGIDDKGIRAKALTQMTKTPANLPTSSGKLLANYPAGTIMLTSGAGLKTIWNESVKQLEADPTTKKSVDEMRQGILTATKLDLDKDILGWMDGEYALGIVPQTEGIGAYVGMGITATVETSSKPATDKALTGLKDAASSLVGGTSRKSTTGKDINEIPSPYFPGNLASFGWLDDKSVFLSTGTVDDKDPLTKGADFQEITGTLPQSNQGYLYLNFDQALNLLNSKVFKSQAAAIPADYLSLLKSMKGAAAVSKIDGNAYQSEGLLVLKPSTAVK